MFNFFKSNVYLYSKSCSLFFGIFSKVEIDFNIDVYASLIGLFQELKK